MGRGKVVRSVQDYLKEPYKSIIELFLDIGNHPLQLYELRYLLLEEHGLRRVSQGTTKGEKMLEKRLPFGDDKVSLAEMRRKLQGEGRMLMNTTGPNKGEPMSTNGLNRLLQNMMSGSGPRILKKVEEGYKLVENPFLQFGRMERERRILECPDTMVTELRHGLTLYNLKTTKKLRKQLNRTEGLQEKVIALQKEVTGLWARQKIGLFVKKLKRFADIRGDGNFLGYCYEMVRWFVRSLGLDEADFNKEQEGMLKIAKNKRARAEARKYGKNISACKEALKKRRASIAILGSGAEGGGYGRLSDISEVSLLSVPGILSAEEDVAVDRVIRAMIDNGIIGRVEGDLLLLDQEMSTLFREHGLDEYLSSAAFEEEPIIVIDPR